MSENDQEKQARQDSEQIALPIEWYVPDHVSTRFADNVIVQAKQHDATISFFETHIPPYSGTPEQNRAFLESLSSVRAECVGRIAVAADSLPEIIKALQIAYDSYISLKKLGERS